MTKNSKSRSDNATELTAVNFKHFVEELLGAMNYEDAQVTKVGNDKGVDAAPRPTTGLIKIHFSERRSAPRQWFG
jgi:Restriction endonuclease